MLKNPSGGPGATFPNNQIPESMLNPVAEALVSKYLPVSSANQCGEVTFGIPQTGDEQEYIGRVDYGCRLTRANCGSICARNTIKLH